MPLALQPKLLRALQERELRPLGEPDGTRRYPGIATTNRPLNPLAR